MHDAAPRHCAPLPAALPEPQSSQILRAACAMPSAQSLGDAQTFVSVWDQLGKVLKNSLGSDKTPPLRRKPVRSGEFLLKTKRAHCERPRGAFAGSVSDNV